ncbi:hypothetical protein YC2023_056958 [Brassica napus]
MNFNPVEKKVTEQFGIDFPGIKSSHLKRRRARVSSVSSSFRIRSLRQAQNEVPDYISYIHSCLNLTLLLPICNFGCKLQSEAVKEAITVIRGKSEDKKRNFVETLELQIGLKNYDPQKDKRFSGSVKLPHIPRPKMKICMLGDAQHVEEAEKMGLDWTTWMWSLSKSSTRTRSSSKSLPRSTTPSWPLNPSLSRFHVFLVLAGKFPTLVSHQESLEGKVNETKATVKFQLKKVLCMGVAVGNLSMEEKQIFQNVQMSVNFLVSLLKKNWQNVCEVFVPQEHNGTTSKNILSSRCCFNGG